MWPHLILKFFEQGIGKDKVETSRIVLPIFIFADSFMPHVDIKMTLAMLMDNHESENQPT